MSANEHSTGVLLIHGGLFERIGPEEFWHEPGIVTGLETAGLQVIAPRRVIAPSSWSDEIEHLLASFPSLPSRWSVVAGSNGCSVAVRMAIDHAELVARLVLCWPATAGDPAVDKLEQAPEEMLRGETLRGVSDAELARISVPVTIIPSDPPSKYHQAATVHRLLFLIPGATSTRAFPESPRSEFGEQRGEFVETLVSLLA
ncbi:MAG TPA: alpha/beta hydrolase [Acidimicrobiia bacterium]|nr:alpha/beta hydrolase [Acidimicrobiia bacterium]